MKNKKWLTYTLGILLTLIVLAAVGGAGYRIGMMQTASPQRTMNLTGPGFGPHFEGNPHLMPGNHFGNDRNFEFRHGGFSMFPFLFGLIHLATLGLLVWFGYKLVQKSGWRFIRVEAGTSPAEQTVSADIKKKKNKSN